jgi:hypothetical protein
VPPSHPASGSCSGPRLLRRVHSTAAYATPARLSRCWPPSNVGRHPPVGDKPARGVHLPLPGHRHVRRRLPRIRLSALAARRRGHRGRLQQLPPAPPGAALRALGPTPVLKSPFHLGHLDDLLGALPNAQVVHTHRAPTAALASWCSFAATFGRGTTTSVDLSTLGQHWLDFWAYAAKRAVAVRGGADARRFHDVRYAELVADPLREVRRLYVAADLELTPTVEQRMQRWLDRHRRRRRPTTPLQPQPVRTHPSNGQRANADSLPRRISAVNRSAAVSGRDPLTGATRVYRPIWAPRVDDRGRRSVLAFGSAKTLVGWCQSRNRVGRRSSQGHEVTVLR